MLWICTLQTLYIKSFNPLLILFFLNRNTIFRHDKCISKITEISIKLHLLTKSDISYLTLHSVTLQKSQQYKFSGIAVHLALFLYSHLLIGSVLLKCTCVENFNSLTTIWIHKESKEIEDIQNIIKTHDILLNILYGWTTQLFCLNAACVSWTNT